jgi:hypothetical protein
MMKAAKVIIKFQQEELDTKTHNQNYQASMWKKKMKALMTFRVPTVVDISLLNQIFMTVGWTQIYSLLASKRLKTMKVVSLRLHRIMEMQVEME